MSERVFVRANLQHGAFIVARFAATAHWCPVEIAVVHHLPLSMAEQ